MPSDERPLRPSYSVDDLREILETLRKASLTDFRVDDAIAAADGKFAILIRSLQSLAFEYSLYCELETRSKFKNYRQVLKHIAAVDFEALPHSVRDRVIPPRLRGSLKNGFEEVRQNALAILDSSPKRGALRKFARYDFVNELADIYEQFTGREAATVGKETDEQSVGKESGERSHRKLLGLFYNFVLAALNQSIRMPALGSAT